jgi:hypothetical protein
MSAAAMRPTGLRGMDPLIRVDVMTAQCLGARPSGSPVCAVCGQPVGVRRRPPPPGNRQQKCLGMTPAALPFQYTYLLGKVSLEIPDPDADLHADLHACRSSCQISCLPIFMLLPVMPIFRILVVLGPASLRMGSVTWSILPLCSNTPNMIRPCE